MNALRLSLLFIAILPICALNGTVEPTIPFDPCDEKCCLASETKFIEPIVLRSKNGVLETKLTVAFAKNRIGNDWVKHRSYNGQLVGPTMRVRPGDKLIIHLENRLPEEPAKTLEAFPEGGKGHKGPGNFNTTNLHTHGLHISPNDPADNVFRSIRPGKEHIYSFEIPRNHLAGTFWYHPHHHGSVALQVDGGMAGALIVDGGLDELPEIEAAKKKEKLFVFQQIRYCRKTGEILPENVYGSANNYNVSTTINGRRMPVIEMDPDEVQRWRFIHAGLSELLRIAVVPSSSSKPGLQTPRMFELATDGNPLGRLAPREKIDLAPGNRSDLLIQASKTPGDFLLIDEETPADESLRGTYESTKYLARIRIRGQRRPMPLPAENDLKCFAPCPISDREVTPGAWKLTFEQNEETKTFRINGESFDPHKALRTVKVNSVEKWVLSSSYLNHPFHIHVNPFEVITLNPKTKKEERVWRDTVMVRRKHPVTIRIRFADFTGKTVLHCHLLEHEDQGMMRTIRIAPSVPVKTGFSRLPVAAPAWRLPDAANKPHELTAFAGRPLMLVFFQHLSCVHCSEQLQAIAKNRQRFIELGWSVAGIGSESQAELAESLQNAEKNLPLLLADPSLEVFKKYGCFSEEPLHGIFLIDGKRRVCWQRVGIEPFTDFDRLCAEGKKALTESNQ